MGSGQPELVSNVSADVIIIDHHQPVEETTARVMVNPHLAGIEGAYYLCASGTTYMVSREISRDNVDLAGLAIAGAIGDKQIFESANRFILEEAIQEGVVSIKKGLKVGSGDIADVLEYSPEPYLDITGDRTKIEEFLDILNIRGEIHDLSSEDMKKLTSTIALKLAKKASSDAIESVIGDVYFLNNEIITNIYDLVEIANTCGKVKMGGLALSLCMRDKTVVEEARSLTRENHRKIISDMKSCEDMIKARKNIRYLKANELESIGTIAGIVVRYIHTDLPFIALNETDDIVKVSGRATRPLIKKGVDLAAAFRDAAGSVGGNGGGHNIASGATIPVGKEEEFLDRVDQIIEKQIKASVEGNLK